MIRRTTRRETTPDPADEPPSPDLTPEQALDDHALHDWVWTAVASLSEPLRIAVILRYFTSTSSYQQIAAACEVPVGTVRSRLNQARIQLDLALRATTEAGSTLAAASTPDLLLIGPQGQQARGRNLLPLIMESDFQAGVRQRLGQVFAGGRITILESELLSPAWDPQHCPPAVLWLMTQSDHSIDKIRLFHPTAARGQPTLSDVG